MRPIGPITRSLPGERCTIETERAHRLHRPRCFGHGRNQRLGNSAEYDNLVNFNGWFDEYPSRCSDRRVDLRIAAFRVARAAALFSLRTVVERIRHVKHLVPLQRGRMPLPLFPDDGLIAGAVRYRLFVLSLVSIFVLCLPAMLMGQQTANPTMLESGDGRTKSLLGESDVSGNRGLLAAGDWLPDPVLASKDAAIEEVSRDLVSTNVAPGGVTVRPYGILWGDMIFSSSRAVPGPFALWIASEQEQGESTWVADARRSRVGIDILGVTHPVLGGLTGGGKVEVDFFDSFVNENQPGVRLRHAYWEAKNENLRLLVGQTWDVISPLLPNTVNFSAGWAAGNVGFRRTQFRVENTVAVGNGNRLTVQGAIAENIIPDLASGPQSAGVTRETGDWPMIQARLAYHRDRGHGRSAAFGVSGHVGETGFDFASSDFSNPALGPEDDARYFGWSFNTDARIVLNDQLRLQSEFFMGSNLSNILGGIAQGVCPCLRVPIRSIGGWAEVSFDFSPHVTTNIGFGIDDPREADSLIGRTYNRFVYVNLFFELTEQLRTGIELSNWRTSFHNRTGEPGFNPTESPDQPGKATIVDWTVQYRF